MAGERDADADSLIWRRTNWITAGPEPQEGTQPCCSGLPRASDGRALEGVQKLTKWLMPCGGRQGLIRALTLPAARAR